MDRILAEAGQGHQIPKVKDEEFDEILRGSDPGWGILAKLLRPGPAETDTEGQRWRPSWEERSEEPD